MILHDSEILADGRQVFTATAFIHHNFDNIEKVFLPRRAHTKKFLPDVFELPGGHIDFGEDMVDGLKREIMEEFEMGVRVGDPFAVFTYRNDIKRSHSIEVIYFAEFMDSIDQIVLHEDDHSEYRWISEDDIDIVFSGPKSTDDPEAIAIKRGFALLRGAHLQF